MNIAGSNDAQTRSLTTCDLIAPGPAMGMGATLDYSWQPEQGDALPDLWHWLYFWPTARQSLLGEDGHPRKGGFMPDLGLPRRMWAASKVRFHKPLSVGEMATKASTILEVSEKSGRSGRLGFVSVKHTIEGQSGLAIEEEQTIVYRDAPSIVQQSSVVAAAPTQAKWQREIHPTEALLFRYSALTFNSHRIHYDRTYAKEQEGYPDLVVQGPLLATLLMDLVHRGVPTERVTEFSFRAIRPTFLGHPFTLCGRPSEDGSVVELWAKDHENNLTMSARAVLA